MTQAGGTELAAIGITLFVDPLDGREGSVPVAETEKAVELL